MFSPNSFSKKEKKKKSLKHQTFEEIQSSEKYAERVNGKTFL
jgi:hypothetical protein